MSKNPLQVASTSDIDWDNLADYIANTVSDDEDPIGSMIDMGLGIDKAQAKKLVDAWFKVDAKKRLSISMNQKHLMSWLENELGAKAESKEDKPLNKPMPSDREGKKKMVYVKDPETGNVKTVHYGDDDYKHNYSKEANANFRARHNCADKKDKTTPGYWACKDLWPARKKAEGKMGKVKSLKLVLEGLNKSDLEAVETEVRSSFEPDEIKDFKSFEDFFAAVDVQNGYEPEWKPKKWKPFYKAVYDKLMQEMK